MRNQKRPFSVANTDSKWKRTKQLTLSSWKKLLISTSVWLHGITSEAETTSAFSMTHPTLLMCLSIATRCIFQLSIWPSQKHLGSYVRVSARDSSVTTWKSWRFCGNGIDPWMKIHLQKSMSEPGCPKNLSGQDDTLVAGNHIAMLMTWHTGGAWPVTTPRAASKTLQTSPTEADQVASS